MANALQQLLEAPAAERVARGTEFTPAEIAQQPKVWQETLSLLEKQREEIQAFTREAWGDGEAAGTNVEAGEHEGGRWAPKGQPRLLLSGAGTSDFIGRSLEALFRHQGVDAIARPSTDITVDPEGIFPQAPFTLLSFARSGNSPEGNAAFNLANQLRPQAVRQIVVTCNAEGELARLAAASPTPTLKLVLPPATNDKGLAMTSSYSSMVVAGQYLALAGKGRAAYLDAFPRMVEAAAGLLARLPDQLAALAEGDFRRAVFLGDGVLYGTAREGHLKLQEMTAGKVICKAESMLGLRHGPMAVIDEQTLVVAFLADTPYVRQYELDLLRELAAKGLGWKRVVVCERAEAELGDLADLVIETNPDGRTPIPDDLKPPVYVIVAQLLALFKSLECGLKPDSPSEGGVINRVVQGVKIYPYEA